MPDEETPQNPFVRFKKHVDAKIGTTVQGVCDLTYTFSDYKTPQETREPDRCDNPSRDTTSHHQSKPDSPPCPASTMDRFTDKQDIDEWNQWAQLSPYSPYNLRHLRQPVPNDLPVDIDAKQLGFEAAFEDLLATSNGQSMMDLRKRVDKKSKILDFFASGEPPTLWVNRLYLDGLLANSRCFIDDTLRWRRGEQRTFGEMRHKSMAEWIETRRKEIAEGPPSRARPVATETSSWWDTDIVINPGKSIRELDEWAEFHSVMDSAAERNGNKSLSTLFKNISGGAFDGDLPTPKNESQKPTVSETHDEVGKTTKTTEEHIDIFGNLHTKTKIKKFDQNGNVVARETYWNITRSSKTPKSEEADWESSAAQEKKEAERDDKSPQGWFWK